MACMQLKRIRKTVGKPTRGGERIKLYPLSCNMLKKILSARGSQQFLRQRDHVARPKSCRASQIAKPATKKSRVAMSRVAIIMELTSSIRLCSGCRWRWWPRRGRQYSGSPGPVYQPNHGNSKYAQFGGLLRSLQLLLRPGIGPGPHWPEANALTTSL